MRCTCLCITVLLAVGLPAVAAKASTASESAATQPSAKTPAYMTGLDPNARSSPEELVRRRWDAVMRVLQDEKLDAQTKAVRVERIVTPVFDFTAMTRLSLGRSNWRKFSTTQRKEFSDLFVKRLRQTYSKRITGYGGEKVVFQPPLSPKTSKSTNSPKPSDKSVGGPLIVHVPVEIVSKARKWTILHKFRRIGKLYRIYDVEIEGISVVRSFRSQFNDVLRRGTPEDLLSRMRKQLSATDKPSTVKGPARP